MEDMASHKAAVNSALGSKGSAQDMIAVAQALDQKSRETDEKLIKAQVFPPLTMQICCGPASSGKDSNADIPTALCAQEKLMAAVQAEKKARGP